ncbi:MAG: valine--tRNA ligase [Chloroflexi bacterium]|nr:valine--tRNA ligase [Chloroflexota bacterium]
MTSETQAAADLSGREYQPYDPALVESRIYDEWMRLGLFKPKPPEAWGGRQPFVMTMPPPNVTGELHIGHALFVAVEDLMVRWHRMLGDPTLWVPGRDHAGIAGQLVVERELAKEGKTRHDLGREAFLDRMWDWMERYGKRIRYQMYRLGASADWDREKFTMEPGPSKAVRTAFVKLYHDGLIYRGRRITSWDPVLMTAVSDLEVEYRDVDGQLTYVRYPLVPTGTPGEAEWIEIATTRPETILADTGIAVHPNDERYAAIVGRKAVVPHVRREIPIVADDVVDPAFGTGAVKVTPGHDPTDFEIGQRHDLPIILAMKLDGTMNEQAGAYAGMKALDARKALVRELEENGQVVKVVKHRHAVGHSFRSGAVIEPIVTEQWYVKIDPLAQPALEAVRDGRIRIIPEHFSKVYYNWMENIRDWCISRQLWWGHRIPVWYRSDGGEPIVSVEDPDPADYPGVTLTQDPDVLDTWFSSGLWPFSTLGWPDDTEDLHRFYPTSVMETGYDILFFWIARMIMQGIWMMDDIPFRDVYLHGMVRVEGQKMSKVKGNVKDPVDLIERYGTDAMRLGLVVGTTPGNDVSISDAKFEAQRNFVNKLWNAGRFILANVTDADLATPRGADGSGGSLADRWIRSRAQAVTAETTKLMRDYQFGEAARVVQDFLWDEVCDWYLEVAKVQLRTASGEPDSAATRSTLIDVYERVLRLLHPFAPFVTEEIWQAFGPISRQDGLSATTKDRSTGRAAGGEVGGSDSPGIFGRPSLMVAQWPEAGPRDTAAEDAFGNLIEAVRAVRRVKTDYRVGSQLTPAVVEAGSRANLFRDYAPVVKTLGRLDPLDVQATLVEKPARALSAVTGGVTVYLPAEGLFDVQQEIARHEKELAEAERQAERTATQLQQPTFTEKAPPDVVAQRREQLAEQRERADLLRARLATLRGLGV